MHMHAQRLTQNCTDTIHKEEEEEEAAHHSYLSSQAASTFSLQVPIFFPLGPHAIHTAVTPDLTEDRAQRS